MSEQKLTPEIVKRREFLTWLGLISGAGALIAAGLWTPESKTSAMYPDFGWWLNRVPNTPSELNFEDGDRAQLRSLMLNDPLYFNRPTGKGLIVDGFRLLTDDKHRSANPLLGEHVNTVLEMAKNALKKEFNDPSPTPENTLLVGLNLLAALHSSYFSIDEAHTLFQVPLIYFNGDTKSKKGLDRAAYYATFDEKILTNMPRVYSADPQNCVDHADQIARCYGFDRNAHFSHHARLSFLLGRSLIHGRSDLFRIPLALQADMYQHTTIEGIVRQFTTTVGDRWENKESFDYVVNTSLWNILAGLLDPNHHRQSGDFDPMVTNDKRANQLGASFALQFQQSQIGLSDLVNSLQLLNTPQVNRLYS